MNIKELVTVFGFDIDMEQIDKLDNSIGQIKMGLTVLGAQVIAFSGAMLFLTKNAANAADKIKDTAIATGTTYEELQRLAYAAQLSGASFDDVAFSLKFLTKDMYAATTKGGEAAAVYKKLGISLKGLNGEMRPASDVMMDIADVLKKTENPTKRAALAMDFFGKNGGGMVQMLSQGSDKVREISRELDAFGGVLSDKTIERLADFNDSWDRTVAVLTTLKNLIGAYMAPAIQEVVDSFRNFLIVNKDVIKSNIVGVVQSLSWWLHQAWRAMKFVTSIFVGFVNMLGGTKIALNLFIGALAWLSSAAVIAGIMGLVAAFNYLGLSIGAVLLEVLAIPLAIAAAIAVLFLIFEDVFAFFSGEESFTGDLVNWIAESFTFLSDKFTNWLMGIGDKAKVLAQNFGNWLIQFTKPFTDFLLGIGDSMAKLAKGDFSGLSATVKGMFGSGSPTGINPATSPINNNSNQKVEVRAPISVLVPPGTDPSMVGEKVESGVSLGIGEIFGRTQRAGASGVNY